MGSHTGHVTGMGSSGRMPDSSYRPGNSGEEELQLQLALAMSKEEAEAKVVISFGVFFLYSWCFPYLFVYLVFTVKANVFIGETGSRRSGPNRTGNQRVAQERASCGWSFSISSAPAAGSSPSPAVSCRWLTEPRLWERAGAAGATEPLGPRSERHSLSKGSFWRSRSCRSLWGPSIKRENDSSSQ